MQEFGKKVMILSDQENDTPEVKNQNPLVLIFSWLLTMVFVGALISILVWQPQVAKSMAELKTQQDVLPIITEIEDVPREALESMPEYKPPEQKIVVVREPETHTEVKTVLRSTAIDYTVESGDAIFRIAKSYNISPETLLWSNYSVLQDNPHYLAVGQTLSIPPTDGIWYQWKEGDTLQGVADKYKADVKDIVLWFGNKLDLTNPTITAGTYVMIPGGERELQQWVVPTIPVGRAGVISSVLGPGSCDTSGISYWGGTGFFVWPAANHYLSGNDYWSGHLAIDIAAGEGAPIYASDGGLVVYSGWISGGYVNMIMIDHANGYQSLYAHMSALAVRCGSTVYQGQVIGYSGMTGGTSTGPHLHFEIRYLGGFVSPWDYLY
jgi:murein DD-endopeptidase MepM/ murein hydrolase activator NlpD